MILVSSQVSARNDSSKERQLEGIKNEAQVAVTKKKKKDLDIKRLMKNYR